MPYEVSASRSSPRQVKDQGRAAGCVSAHEASNHWIRGERYTSFSEFSKEARKAKEEKYHHLKQVLQSKGYRKVEVDGFVVGALGSWDLENDTVLLKLSIGHKYAVMFRKLCCTEAIKGSYAI